MYEEKLGQKEGSSDLIELLKDSGEVDLKSLLPQKVDVSINLYVTDSLSLSACQQGYIQVTYLEPYFDDWELKTRVSAYDKSFNISECTHVHLLPW